MPTITICRTEQDVPPALHLFREAWAQHNSTCWHDVPVVCWNAPFDCWTVELATKRLGLKSFHFDMRKYGSRNVVDLMREMAMEGCAEILSRSQKGIAAGADMPVEEDCDGSLIAKLYAEQNWPAIAAHNESDVVTLAALWRFWAGDKRAILLDVETVARDGVERLRPLIKPKQGLTDPKKIEASIEDKLGKAALDPWLNRIVCLGFEVV